MESTEDVVKKGEKEKERAKDKEKWQGANDEQHEYCMVISLSRLARPITTPSNEPESKDQSSEEQGKETTKDSQIQKAEGDKKGKEQGGGKEKQGESNEHFK